MTLLAFLTCLIWIILLIVAGCCFINDAIGYALCFLSLAGCMSGVTVSVWQSPEEKLMQAKADQAQHTAEVTPRKVSVVDGCTVYTFKPQDRWLYFTKCANAETTTQNAYTTQSQKTTRTETMEIKTK
jgi:outer membrane lipoprotein SlyB